MGFGDSVYDSCFQGQLNAPDLLQAFEESADRALLWLLCDDAGLHKSTFKYLVSTKVTQSHLDYYFEKFLLKNAIINLLIDSTASPLWMCNSE